MLIAGIALGLVLGLLLGGRLDRLADIRLRFLPLLFFAVIVRFATEALLGVGVEPVDALRVPLLAAAYAILLFTLWHNRGYPGLALAFVGVACNALVILANGGYMPVWMPAYAASGLEGPLTSPLHVMIPEGSGAEFFVRLGPLGDVIPIPVPGLWNVASIGDLFLSTGLAFFLFASLLRVPEKIAVGVEAATVGLVGGLAGTVRLPRPTTGLPGGTATLEAPVTAAGAEAIDIRPSTGLSPALENTAALDRPLVLGSSGVGMASPAHVPLPHEADGGRAATMALDGGVAVGAVPGATGAAMTVASAPGIAVPAPRARRGRPVLLRARRHPYVRLALNGSFSALWVGQLISLFGDRVNQLALIAFVFEITDSPTAVALTFLVSTIPNLLFSPVAGAFVDRWDQKQVLVVSDILRASLALLIPVAVLINVWLAYPLVFLITTVSIFFRPARVAILPRMVARRDLLAANSAMWVGETIADVVNYPIAGLFVVFLASSLPLAFWFDAATYLASALLLATIVVPPLARRRRGEGAVDDTAAEDTWTADDAGAEVTGDELPGAHPSVVADLKVGWAFLRHETVLLASTIQATAGQLSVGVITVASVVLARELTASPGDEYRGTYAFMETAIGLGSLIGGFVLGLLSARIRKGLLIIAAYTAFGMLLFFLGGASSIPIALGLLFGLGVANMAFIIPSQTLFQERTPPELMGRVVSLRFALVFGGMSIAMAVGGLLVTEFGPGPVISAAGLISVVAGLAGLSVRALRRA